MRKLSLFSVIGGIDLAAHWAGMETVAFCEREPFPQKVLNKHWPDVPIYDDVCTLTAERLEEDGIIGPGRTIDIISGGYPCQPFSNAGKRQGKEDDRHLWPEVHRLLQEIRPRWFVGENVAGHITLGLDDVLSDLGDIGYTAQPFVIPSSAVGAPHRRDRVFIVGYTECSGCSGEPWGWTKQVTKDGHLELEERVVGDSTSSRLQEWRQSGLPEKSKETGTGLEPEPERSGENVAYSESKPERGLSIRTGTEDTGFTCGCENVAHTHDKRVEGCEDTRGISRNRSERRNKHARRCSSNETGRTTESILGGVLDGLSDWLDGYQWPAGLGAEQHDWEPPRVATGVKDRVGRLKALGNAVNPVQVYPIMAAIKAIDDQL